MQTFFGSGNLFAVNTAAGTQTPRQFGTLQECSLDFTWTVKELYGQYQFPVDVGRGTAKLTGKAKAANINGALLADIFFQPTTAPGTTETIGITNEPKTPAGGPPPTATASNTTGFVDEGCLDATTGLQMSLVASAPVAGVSYMVNNSTGVYTFANTQGPVYISYRYTTTVATKGSFVYDNQLLGTSPFFSVTFQGQRAGKPLFVRLRQCIASKLTLQSKLEDFMIPEFDFQAFADAGGIVFDWSSAE
jgi:hypothetical protein